jgi:hypothetical protein
MIHKILLIYTCVCVCVCVCVRVAVVGLNYKLYKIHSMYIKIIHNINYFMQNYEIFQALHRKSSF